MIRENLKILTAAVLLMVALINPLFLKAQSHIVPNWKINPEKELNPNTTWLREAKWGLFTHYLGSESITGEEWNARVNSFQVKKFADQLSRLKTPYFFITLGRGNYYCSPNQTYEELFGPSAGKLSERDLVADLAAELIPRGIKLGLYMGAVGRGESAQIQQMWRKVITEWSERYGNSISAWWIDGAVYETSEDYKDFTDVYKAGNPDVLVSYNVGPVGMNRDQLMPVTEHEDYLAGECDLVLPTCGKRVYDNNSDFYLGPNIAGDQLHFLNFLGSWWGGGEPRFSNELVISWTKHINDHIGAVTWDLPLSHEGIMAENYFIQVKALSKSIARYNK